MAEGALFCDARESLVNEAGDYLMAGLSEESIRAELGEVLTGSAEGRRDDAELTVFKSLGLGVEDLAAAEHVYERARAEGVGSAVPF
jgi:ornithine cyclodeaminase